MTPTGWETKEISVPLAHRKRTFESKASFAERVTSVIFAAVAEQEVDGWVPDEPLEYESLRRAGRIRWTTAFSINPLGDMNKAVGASIRLKRLASPRN